MSSNSNKSVSALSKSIKESLLSGQVPVGDLLPSIRDLTKTYDYSMKTIHKALSYLVDEGFLIAEPYVGYRVTPLANDPEADCPLVFLLDFSSTSKASMSPTYISLIEKMQEASRSRDWSMLVIEQHGETVEKILRQIKNVRAFGVILDGGGIELITALKEAKIPVVVVNSYEQNCPVDSVMQDGYMGSKLATNYMLDKNYSNLIWFGSEPGDAQSDQRLSGFLTEMYKHHGFVNDKMACIVKKGEDIQAKAKDLLLNQKPEAIITLWSDFGWQIKNAAEELGLKIGQDFDLISWCMDEVFDQINEYYFHQLKVPLVTWSAKEMAETALSLLAERRKKPDLPIVNVKIPTQIRNL